MTMLQDKLSTNLAAALTGCVLVHTPFGKDGEVIGKVLERAGIRASGCETLSQVFAGLERGASAVIIADEALNKEIVSEFACRLRDQPQWSDLPVIVMTSGGEADEGSIYRLRLLEPLGNVTLLERPLRKITLVSAVRTALRARARQYEIRDYLEERKRSEQDLRTSEQRWSFLANALPQFIWVSRPDGSLEFINQYWFDYTGLPSGQIGAWRHAVHPDDLHYFNHIFPADAAEPRELSFEYRVRRASDSTWRWHICFLKPEHSATPSTLRWIGVGIDIHDRREIEAALRRANGALEQFAYAAAHDLQEPVRTIAVYAQLVDRACRDKLDDKTAQYLRFTIEGAQRMQRLIYDLFTYTRAVDDQSGSESSCDANQVMKIVLQNLQSSIVETGASVLSEPLPEVPVSETHLLQLLQNLVSNALKYRSHRPPQVNVSAVGTDSEWVFAVQDNGQGIPPEHHQRIFQVFKRLHGRDVPGTGIGLAICERVVNHYGGRIWLESQVDKGTTFFFSLPRVRSRVPSA